MVISYFCQHKYTKETIVLQKNDQSICSLKRKLSPIILLVFFRSALLFAHQFCYCTEERIQNPSSGLSFIHGELCTGLCSMCEKLAQVILPYSSHHLHSNLSKCHFLWRPLSTFCSISLRINVYLNWNVHT